jgi:Coenzyme PQQ synthesis protein D (PqqD)
MPDISLDDRVAIHDDAVFRELDGEAVILQLDAGMYFGLDCIGTRLWQLIEAHGRLRSVLDAALSEFDVAPDVLERDLLDLVTALAEKRLVVVQ